MSIDYSKRYFCVGSQNGVDEPQDFIKNGNWRIGWFGDETNSEYKKVFQSFERMRVGDYIFLKSTFTKKNNLPFPNVNNRTASVMRIIAAGIIEGIVDDGHTVKVNWIHDYSIEQKLWYFYTGRNTIWELDLIKGLFAEELIAFALNEKDQDYSLALNKPNWSHFVTKEGEMTETIISKNQPLKLVYEDLKKKKLIAYTFRDYNYDVSETSKKNITWKDLLRDIAIRLEIDRYDDIEITVDDAYPNLPEIKKDYFKSMFINAVGLYKSKEDVQHQIEIRGSSPVLGIGEIKFDDQSLWFGSIVGIDVILLIQGMINKFGKDSDVLKIYYMNEVQTDTVDEEFIDEKVIDEIVEEEEKDNKLNTILFGPPGTGKTYSIEKYKKRLINNQTSEELKYDFDGLGWRHAIYLAFKANGYQPMTIKEIENMEIVQKYAETKNSKTPYGTISTTIIENSTYESTKTVNRRGTDYFERVNNRWQLTEVGKAEAEEIKEPYTDNNASTQFYEFITFHQSFGYEDFIEGIRAEVENDVINYVIREGVFLKFCKAAMRDKEQGNNNNFLFVIDEFNRGNISKILGELITLIEVNKRISYIDGEWKGMQVTLPYSGEKFGVPDNVYILATMNTADRSLATIDTAIRRRFDFVEMMPDSEVVRKNIGEDGAIGDIDIAGIMNAMNQRIQYLYDRDHMLGHALFLNIESLEDLQYRFENKIIPLLQEYFFDDYQKIKAILNDVDGIYIKQKQENLNRVFDYRLIQDWYEQDRDIYELNYDVSIGEFEQFIRSVITYEETEHEE